MSKKIKAIVKLQIPAGQATPAPPVGPVLAQHGLNIAEFCQKFNEVTEIQKGWTIPVEVVIYEDRSYIFNPKAPLVSEFIKKAVGIEKGSREPNKTKVGKITRAQVREIAQKKITDLNTEDISAAEKIIEGTIKSMGIEIVEG